ncbi:MAG: hypothetical protein U0271_25515 [Polyangiaceae bacterium]
MSARQARDVGIGHVRDVDDGRVGRGASATSAPASVSTGNAATKSRESGI